MICPTVLAESESTVHIELERRLTNFDIGITGGEISPNGNQILAYGAEGFAIIISASNPDTDEGDISLENETTNTFRAVSWHPQGRSALIVGDDATIYRYNSTTYALEDVSIPPEMGQRDLWSVSWNSAGSVAFIGSNDGSIWKYQANEIVLLNNTAVSRINDIDCLKNKNYCVVTSLNDGVAVIDPSDNVEWIGGTDSITWVGVSCVDPSRNACSLLGSGMKIGDLRIDIVDTKASYLSSTLGIEDLQGDFVSDSDGASSSTLVGIAPIGLMRWTQYEDEAMLLFDTEFAVETDILLGGDSFACAWEVEKNRGFVLTEDGRIISFIPAEEAIESSTGEIVLAWIVAICVLGLPFGMIYWNSPWLQRKYKEIFGKKKR